MKLSPFSFSVWPFLFQTRRNLSNVSECAGNVYVKLCPFTSNVCWHTETASGSSKELISLGLAHSPHKPQPQQANLHPSTELYLCGHAPGHDSPPPAQAHFQPHNRSLPHPTTETALNPESGDGARQEFPLAAVRNVRSQHTHPAQSPACTSRRAAVGNRSFGGTDHPCWLKLERAHSPSEQDSPSVP